MLIDEYLEEYVNSDYHKHIKSINLYVKCLWFWLCQNPYDGNIKLEELIGQMNMKAVTFNPSLSHQENLVSGENRNRAKDAIRASNRICYMLKKDHVFFIDFVHNYVSKAGKLVLMRGQKENDATIYRGQETVEVYLNYISKVSTSLFPHKHMNRLALLALSFYPKDACWQMVRDAKEAADDYAYLKDKKLRREQRLAYMMQTSLEREEYKKIADRQAQMLLRLGTAPGNEIDIEGINESKLERFVDEEEDYDITEEDQSDPGFFEEDIVPPSPF